MGDISHWLAGLDLDEYATLFEEHKIDFDVLPELDESDLKDLDIPLGHRKKLLKAIAELDSASASASTAVTGEAERRQVTIMFCDLVGSTELSARLDPEDLRSLINQYQNACRAAIAEYHGFVARYMGDGVLAYFGYPKSHEDDAERAVRSALALRDAVRALNKSEADGTSEDLAIRIGIATGLVVVGDLIGEGASQESPVIGETPNIAARLQALAAPDAIVLAESTHRLTGRSFEYRALGKKSLKGVGAPIQAWEVLRERYVESRFAAASESGLTPMVGREEEIELLLKRWGRAREGDGQVVLVTGEAGIGKSRLTRELHAAIAGEPNMRLGYQCLVHHQNSAFHPVIAQLERAAGIEHRHAAAERLDRLESLLRRPAEPDVRDLALFADLLSVPNDGRYADVHLEAEQRKRHSLSALIRQLEYLATNDPVLCVFEDVHWIDPSTLEFLERVVERASTLPILLIVTSRPGFSASWTGQPHTSLLALSRMDRHDSRAIVDLLVRHTDLAEPVVAEIVAKTDGIPLFIEELTRTLLDSSTEMSDHGSASDQPPSSLGIPATLQDSLMSRLDRLELGKSVAQVASALGREFSHELLGAVCEQEKEDIDAALDELIASGLVLRRGSGSQASYVFKHALIQDVAYQSLLRSARQTLHRRIAAVLSRTFAGTVELQPEILALHYSEGGQVEQAISYWQRAGDRAAARAAHTEAIGHYSRGMEFLSEIEGEEQRATAEVDLNLGLAASMRVIERWDEALQALDRAETAARNYDRPAKLAEVHYLKGNLYFPLGKFDECLQEHERSRDFSLRAGLLDKEARALGGLGDAYYQRGQMITAEKHFDSCVRICQEHGFEQIEVANLPMRGVTRMYELRFDEGIRDTVTSASHARRIQNLRAEAVSTQIFGYFAIDMENFDEAEQAFQESIELCRRLGSANLGAGAQAHYGRLLFELGRRQQSVTTIREAYAISRESGLRFVSPTILGYLSMATDDPEERSQALREGEHLLHQGSISHNYFRFYRSAMEACLETGDWNETERYASALEEYTRAEPLPWTDFLIERGRALAAYGRGDRSAKTRETLSRLQALARSSGFARARHALDTALSDYS